MGEEQVDDLPVDFDRLPGELRSLARFVRQWGVLDDEKRATRMGAAPNADLRALIDAFAPHWDAINGWLDQHDADPDRYEASVLSAASEAAMEAQLELDRRSGS